MVGRNGRATIILLLIVIIIGNTVRTPTLFPNLHAIDSSVALSDVALAVTRASDMRHYNASYKAHLPRCQMLIYNEPDWHYEILESIAVRYPIPWERFECSTAEPVLVEYWVSGTKHKLGWEKGNDQVEHAGFIKYYEQYLLNTTRSRADGLSVQFGKISSLAGMYYDAKYHVVVRASRCIAMEEERVFCVSHFHCDEGDMDCKDHPEWRSRMCWLNPMHECYFLARDLPRFPEKDKSNDKIIGCMSGAAKDIERLATALHALRKPEDLEIRHFNRYFEIKVDSRKAARLYRNHGIDDMIKLVAELDFIKFQKLYSECDFIMTLLNPDLTSYEYFPGHGSKLSGSISQAIAYQAPVLLHQDLYDVYAQHLVTSSIGYRNTKQFTRALRDMLQYIREQKKS